MTVPNTETPGHVSQDHKIQLQIYWTQQRHQQRNAPDEVAPNLNKNGNFTQN